MSNDPIIRQVNLTREDVAYLVSNGPSLVQLLCFMLPLGQFKNVPGVLALSADGTEDADLDDLQFRALATARIGLN